MKAASREDRFALDLNLVAGEDEARAREAFGRLWGHTRDAVGRMLLRLGAGDEDAEDVAQSTFAELWGRRTSLRARSGGEWYALARRSARWQLSRRLAVPLNRAWSSDADDVPERDLPRLDEIVEASLARGRILDAANRLWLGELNADAPPDIVAASVKLVLVDGLGAEDAAAMFGAEFAQVEGWLRDPAALARALYACLCWPSEAIAGHVLRPEAPLTTRDLDEAAAGLLDDSCFAGWTALEAQIVCRRLRHGLREDQILQFVGGRNSPQGVEEVLARVRDRLPFARIARSLRAALERIGREGRMADPGLWKRVALDYDLRDLSHRQIVELAGPPAGVAPFRLDAPKLNNWLSMGRLHAQLADFLKEGER